MSFDVFLSTRIPQGTTAQLTGVLLAEDGTPIPASALGALILTLKDRVTGTVINERDEQDVLNKNGVVVDENGQLTWTLSTADTGLVGSGTFEQHVAVFQWTWSISKVGKTQITHTITGLLNG